MTCCQKQKNVLCKHDPLQVDTVHDQLDKESENVDEKREEAMEALASITIAPTLTPVQATEPNLSPWVKINDALKSFTLKRAHDPMDLDSWKCGFKVYYSSSSLTGRATSLLHCLFGRKDKNGDQLQDCRHHACMGHRKQHVHIRGGICENVYAFLP